MNKNSIIECEIKAGSSKESILNALEKFIQHIQNQPSDFFERDNEKQMWPMRPIKYDQNGPVYFEIKPLNKP